MQSIIGASHQKERFSHRFDMKINCEILIKIEIDEILTRDRYVLIILLYSFQVDSIFYLRRPDDLVAFLNQFDYRQTIMSINAQLLSLQMEITDKVQQSTFFQVEIMSHTECLIYYSLKDEDMYSTLKDKKYFNRINTKRMITKSNDVKRGNDLYPVCDDVPFSLSCFEHLNSMINRKRLQMSAEVPLHSDELGVLKESFVKMIKFGLQQEPLSWKYPLLSSYFWRLVFDYFLHLLTLTYYRMN